MTILFTLFIMGILSIGFGPSPCMLNYQGVALDSSPNAIGFQNISLKFELLQASSKGSNLYTDFNQSEVTASSLTLFHVEIVKRNLETKSIGSETRLVALLQ